MSALILISCEDKPEPPKVIYEDKSTTAVQKAADDTTQIEVADLPIHLEGTSFLIHPVADMGVAANNRKKNYGYNKVQSVLTD